MDAKQSNLVNQKEKNSVTATADDLSTIINVSFQIKRNSKQEID